MFKVSVVVPVYNAQKYLRECLDSITKQTLKEIEIICVNDGSTDNSLDILNEYAQKDNRFKIINQENGGSGSARNRGIDASDAEYLMILDADDFFEDNMLEYLYYTAKSDQSDVAICGFYVYDNRSFEDVQIEYPHIPENLASPVETTNVKDLLFNISAPNAWTKLWKTDLIKKNKIHFGNYSYGEDAFFTWNGLAHSQKISFTNIPFIHYRWFNNEQQTSLCQNKLDCLLKTFTTLYDNLIKKGLYETYKQAYTLRIKTSLQYEFSNNITANKRGPLCSLSKNLPQTIFRLLFDSQKRPAVSIVLAVYNMEKYLPKCLDSLINQTLKNIEIICVDDGSTDDSLKLLQEYANKDSRIKVLTQKNQKLPLARRHAMEIATGEYIQYVDADDYIELDACECLYLYSKLYELDMCFFAGENFSDNYKKVNDAPLQLTWLPDHFVSVFSYKNLSVIIHRLNVGSCLTFYRHDFLKENHIEWINEALAYEDTPFFIESLFSAKRIGALKENFYHRRKHVGCITEQLNFNFPDYCQVVLKALTVAKRLADEITLSNYYKGITLNAFVVYKKGCSKEAQQKFKQIMYDFFQKAEEITGIQPLKEVRNWCKIFEKRKTQL